MYKVRGSLVPVKCILQASGTNKITFLYPLIEPARILDLYKREDSVIRKGDYILTFDTFPCSYASFGPYFTHMDHISQIETIHVRKGERVEMGSPLYTIKLSVRK